MRKYSFIPKFLYRNEQYRDLQLKDPMKDLNKQVQELEKLSRRKQIYRTQTGEVPISLQQSWSGSKEVTLADKRINLPYNFEGIDSVPDKKESFLAKNVFYQNNVSQAQLFTHFIKVYKGVLYSMCGLDEDFLQEYTEKNFCDRIISSIKDLKKTGDEILPVEDFSDEGGKVKFECHEVEMALIRGLNVDRTKNKGQNDYHFWRDIDEMGLVTYTPMKVTDPNNFIRDQPSMEQLYNTYQQVVMRILAQSFKVQWLSKIQSPHLFIKEIFADEDNYSYNHLVIFESQLIVPERINKKYQLVNYQQWLNNFKLDKWKIADIDNWMDGNPMILQDNLNKEYKDDIFEGTDYDPKYLIDIRKV